MANLVCGSHALSLAGSMIAPTGKAERMSSAFSLLSATVAGEESLELRAIS